MANHYSALKRARQEKKRTEVNRRTTTRLRHQIRTFRRALEAGDPAEAKTALPPTVSVIDRAARVGIIKKNAAARYKSRLTARLNALSASAPKPTAP